MRKWFILFFGSLLFNGLAQNQQLTFMTYNLMYFRSSNPPCTHTQTPSQRTATLKTIIDFAKPDIWLVNELGSTTTNADHILTNVLNVGGVNRFDRANYSNNSFSSLTNMLFFDSTLVGLAKQDRVEKDLSNNDLVRVLDVYTLYYKEPGLALGGDTSYLTVVGVHLKAGSDAADQAERAKSTEALMAYLSAHFPSQNVLVAGDMNVYKSSEACYQDMIAASDTSVRLYDPVNMPGNWNNNSSFAPYHTQSTHSNSSGCFSGGGGDDRFDQILISNVLKKGSKRVKYVLNSYGTLGQDGNHFNQSINSGSNSSAPSSIIDALYDFSDHLPVYAKFEFSASGIGLAENKRNFDLQFNNPVSDILNLNFKGNATQLKLEIVDLSGKVIQKETIPGGERRWRLNCSSWNSGLYLIRISDNNGNVLTRKCIKH